MIELGIGIISFGCGLFVGSIISNLKHGTNTSTGANGTGASTGANGTGANGTDNKENVFKKWVQARNIKKEQEMKDKIIIDKMRMEALDEARKQAYHDIKPELIKHLKEQEMKKFTGEDKKDKMAKFANMFATSSNQGSSAQGSSNQSSGNDISKKSYSEEKLNMMLGSSAQGSFQKTEVITPTRIYNDTAGVSSNYDTTNKVINNDKIDMMLGKQNKNNINNIYGKMGMPSYNEYNEKSMTQKYKEHKAEEERLKRMIR